MKRSGRKTKQDGVFFSVSTPFLKRLLHKTSQEVDRHIHQPVNNYLKSSLDKRQCPGAAPGGQRTKWSHGFNALQTVKKFEDDDLLCVLHCENIALVLGGNEVLLLHLIFLKSR